MYIHESLKNGKFNSNKKLNLLKNNIITIAQFVNLIDITDPFTIIGPAIVDKDHINDFIQDWKNSQMNLKTLHEAVVEDITIENVFNKLHILVDLFPEISILYNELEIKLNGPNSCPVCTRNKYLINIVNEISKYYKDGRDLGEFADFVNDIVIKYSTINNSIIDATNLNDFDINWLNPDSFQGVGYDLIQGLHACFDCTKKHLSRAKAFYEEWKLGYPEHGTLMYNSFIEANKTIEEGYVLFWDSLGQLDMASCELVGSDLNDLNKDFRTEIIELANEIRNARILFQEDSTKVPDWNHLRVEVQKLQNKLSKTH